MVRTFNPGGSLQQPAPFFKTGIKDHVRTRDARGDITDPLREFHDRPQVGDHADDRTIWPILDEQQQTTAVLATGYLRKHLNIMTHANRSPANRRDLTDEVLEAAKRPGQTRTREQLDSGERSPVSMFLIAPEIVRTMTFRRRSNRF